MGQTAATVAGGAGDTFNMGLEAGSLSVTGGDWKEWTIALSRDAGRAANVALSVTGTGAAANAKAGGQSLVPTFDRFGAKLLGAAEDAAYYARRTYRQVVLNFKAKRLMQTAERLKGVPKLDDKVRSVRGSNTDQISTFDPATKTVTLTAENLNEPFLFRLRVMLHEIGHARQLAYLGERVNQVAYNVLERNADAWARSILERNFGTLPPELVRDFDEYAEFYRDLLYP